MGKGLGRIQRKILKVLDEIESRWVSAKDKDQRWVGLDVVTFMVYHKEELSERMGVRDLRFSKGEHRRIWESVRTLEKRGLVQTRIERIKGSGWKARFGGIQLWLEVRKL